MDVEGLNTLAQIAGNLSLQAVLLAWVFHEVRERKRVQQLLENDWQRQREIERIDHTEK